MTRLRSLLLHRLLLGRELHGNASADVRITGFDKNRGI